MNQIVKQATGLLTDMLADLGGVPRAVTDIANSVILTIAESALAKDDPKEIARKAAEALLTLQNVQLAHDQRVKAKYPGFTP